jgi:hypothetical protein
MKKETVIIVHGTWSNTPDGVNYWYINRHSIGSEPTFADKLNSILADRRSNARCWAHCSRKDEIFSWSGHNSWADRNAAVLKLRSYVTDLIDRGWTCHLIGHSHGGNIVTDAFQSDLRGIDTIVTLGTPFMNTMALAEARAKKFRLFIYTLLSIPLAISILFFAYTINGGLGSTVIPPIIAQIYLIIGFILIIITLFRRF